MNAATMVTVVLATVGGVFDDTDELLERVETPGEETARVEALEALLVLHAGGELTDRRLATLVEDLLLDEDQLVRHLVIRTAADVLDPDVGGKLLGEFLERSRDLAKKRAEEFERARRSPAESDEELAGQLFAVVSASSQLHHNRALIDDLRTVVPEALGRVRSDEAVDGLVELVEWQGLGVESFTAARAALAFGTETATEPVVDVVLRWSKTEKELEDVVEDAERAKPRRNPTDHLSDDEWRRIEDDRIASELPAARENLALTTERQAQLCALLGEFATVHGLEGPPGFDAASSKWKTWWRKAKGVLPRDLEEQLEASEDAAPGD